MNERDARRWLGSRGWQVTLLGLLTTWAFGVSAVTRAAAAPEPPVIPQPVSIARGTGVFEIGSRLDIVVPPGDSAAERSAHDLAQFLSIPGGLPLRVVSGAARDGAIVLGRAGSLGPEGYRLDVTPHRITIEAESAAGWFYGGITLWQLARAAGAAQVFDAQLIEDRPRFRWRGLLLDSARHFQSPEFVMRYIDWMALHKLNVLSWHLTDDQGWRLEIRKHPRLTSVGAWRVPAGRAAQGDIDAATGRPRLHGGFYTQADVHRIVAHAAERHVTIVPEIDMPGHATAALVAYPALAARPQDLPPAVPADWGNFPHLLNIDESTFRFIEDVLDEVMALFPGEYVHLGGDEVVTDEWQNSPGVQARMRELGITDVGAVQGYFERRLGEYLAAHGRRLIGWDEIVSAGLAPNATVISWHGVQGAIAAAQAGHDAVLAPDPLMYLDHRQGSSPAEPPGRGPVITVKDLYGFDPLPGPLADLRQHLLGLQANLWTEHVRTEERAAYMTWPRAAAVAEVAWSPPARLDWGSFLERLPAQFDRYRVLGIHYSDAVFRPERTVGPYERHMSQDLKTCTDKVVLNLEDDAPLQGERAVFLIDIENPCWLLPGADLSRATTLTAAVGQVPFNFQIGRDRDAIRLSPPRTPAGELEVRLDGCEGEPLAVLPLAPAAGNDAVTVLPAAPLPPRGGPHTLCFRFTQRTLDPMWAIDWVELSP